MKTNSIRDLFRGLCLAVVALSLSSAAIAAPPPNNAVLAGNWVNTAPGGGLVNIDIQDLGGGAITIHGYGDCVPTPCDWGAIPADPVSYSVSGQIGIGFSATYDMGFKESRITGVLTSPHSMVVIIVDVYAAGDSRSDRVSVAVLRRQAQIGG